MRALAGYPNDPERLTVASVSIAVLALIALRLVAAGFTELGADETYYLLWSRYPDWSYFDHPPMVAWWIAAGTAMFGDGAFGVRLLFVLSAIPTSIAIYATARALFDKTTAALATLWINATLLVGVGGISASPDAPAVMFWALATWAFVRLVISGNGAWWLAVGLFAGLGVSSKLTDLFLGLGILLTLLVRPDLRRWLASPWLWSGGVVAVAAVAPMVAWNAHHDWVTFAYQFRRVSVGALTPLRLPEMIATQFALLNPVVGIFVGLAVVAWLRRLPAYPGVRIGLLMWTVVPLAAYMALHALSHQVPGNWLAPIFPSLVIAGAAAAIVAPAERWAGLRALAFPLGVALSIIGLVLAANPGGILPAGIDPSRANRGWADVALDVERLRTQAGATWIATTHYSSDAAIGYRLRDTGTPVVPIVARQRYAFAPEPDAKLRAEPALVVGRADTVASLAPCFATMTEVGTIERRTSGTTIDVLAAYLGTGLAADAFSEGCDQPRPGAN